jgi:hypothetical protein
VAVVLRVEVHGTNVNLEKLKGPLAGLNPEWFVFECGVVQTESSFGKGAVN